MLSPISPHHSKQYRLQINQRLDFFMMVLSIRQIWRHCIVGVLSTQLKTFFAGTFNGFPFEAWFNVSLTILYRVIINNQFMWCVWIILMNHPVSDPGRLMVRGSLQNVVPSARPPPAFSAASLLPLPSVSPAESSPVPADAQGFTSPLYLHPIIL